MSMIESTIASLYSWISTRINSIFYCIFICFSLVLCFFVLKLYNNENNEKGEILAKKWNAAFYRLGITPIFPPQENIYVGDVYLQAVASKAPFKDYPKGFHDGVLDGRLVLVGQLSSRLYPVRSNPNPFFGNSRFDKDGRLSLDQSMIGNYNSSDDNNVSIYNVLFPKFSLFGSESLSSLARIFGVGAASGISDEISVNGVQVDEVGAYQTYRLLERFCADPETSGFCSEASARRLLGFMIGEDVNRLAPTADGKEKSIFDLQLIAVFRVYMTREIRVRNGTGTDVEGFFSETTGVDKLDLKVPTLESSNSRSSVVESSNSDKPDQDGMVKAENGSVASDEKPQSSSSNGFSGRFSAKNSRLVEVNSPLLRPLVIGYNAVTMKVY